MADEKDEALALIDSMNHAWSILFNTLKEAIDMLPQMHDVDDRTRVSRFVSNVFGATVELSALTGDYCRKHPSAVPQDVR